MAGEGVGIFANLLPCVSTKLNLADEVKQTAVMMQPPTGTVHLRNLGRFSAINTELFEELSHR
jgi:hypothetical protein